MGEIQAKQGLGCWQEGFILYCKQQSLMGVGQTAQSQENFAIYPNLCLVTVFTSINLTQNCYLYYNINIFY